MAWVVLVFTPVTANDLVNIDQLPIIDTDTESAYVHGDRSVHVEVVCDRLPC